MSGVFPARPHAIERRLQASIARLPQLVQRVLRLEHRMAEMTGEGGPEAAAPRSGPAPGATRAGDTTDAEASPATTPAGSRP
jgi:hypothetical protein